MKDRTQTTSSKLKSIDDKGSGLASYRRGPWQHGAYAMASIVFLVVCGCEGNLPALDLGAKYEQAPEIPIEEALETLSLRMVEATPDQLSVDLVYKRTETQAGPRAVELYISYSDGLEYLNALPMEATERANKEMIVQDKGDRLRLVLFASSNTLALDSGVIARLTFHRYTHAEVLLELVPQMPIFAPPEAQQALKLSEALIVGGN